MTDILENPPGETLERDLREPVRSPARRIRPERELLQHPLPPGPRPEKPLPDPSDWTFELVGEYHEVIRATAQRFGLDTYANQLEVITAEQMMDAYASVGMPVNYRHWSYGKEFISNERSYRRGQMGLAYEIVINSDPCISFLMEENTTAMQALVIAHAAYGHNSFFKGNYLFRLWTDASSIIDYLVYARNYVAECEEKHGMQAVEEVLDSCHALQNYGVDRYHRPSKISLAEELARQAERHAYAQRQVNDIWRTLPRRADRPEEASDSKRFPAEPQENILYFIEKNAPLLEPWQREIVRIVRKIAQYFYPQRQTQVMNEGWATFWHHHLLNTLYDEGHLTDGVMIEWLKSHTNVIYQPPVGHRAYSGINPYALGFAMYTDIKRICENPTPEDIEWFPGLAGTPWLPALHHAMRNFKDESFIGQYLSPKVIRDLRLFAIVDDEHVDHLHVSAIHDTAGYRHVREALSKQYDLSTREPDIQVWNVNRRGDRSLTLRHTRHNNRPLNDSAHEVLKHVARLWGFGVNLESVDGYGDIAARWALHAPEPH
jgi:stage V sporulation protein R